MSTEQKSEHDQKHPETVPVPVNVIAGMRSLCQNEFTRGIRVTSKGVSATDGRNGLLWKRSESIGEGCVIHTQVRSDIQKSGRRRNLPDLDGAVTNLKAHKTASRRFQLKRLRKAIDVLRTATRGLKEPDDTLGAVEVILCDAGLVLEVQSESGTFTSALSCLSPDGCDASETPEFQSAEVHIVVATDSMNSTQALYLNGHLYAVEETVYASQIAKACDGRPARIATMTVERDRDRGFPGRVQDLNCAESKTSPVDGI